MEIDPICLNAARRRFLETRAPSILTWQRRPKPTYIATVSFEASSAAGRARFPMSREVSIKYSDYCNDKTERECLIQSLFSYSGSIYLDVYCYMRGDLRTFKLENIMKINDIDFKNTTDREKEILKFLQISENFHETDYFVHPDNFHSYTRPMAILKRKAEDKYLTQDEVFSELLKFCSISLSRGYWNGWYSIQKAAGLALAGLTLDASYIDWKSEAEQITKGKFSLKTFREMIASD